MSSLEQMRTQLKELAERLKLPDKTVAYAIHILERLDNENGGYLQGLKPLEVVASCLYVAGLLKGEGPTQWALCTATDWNVSNTTIRKRYRDIAEKLQLQALLTISKSRRLPRREKYFCPICSEYKKNLDLWKSHLKHDHDLRGWGQSMVRARDFDMEGNLVDRQILKRIRETQRRRAQAKETLERMGK
jgi:hypothetical protein